MSTSQERGPVVDGFGALIIACGGAGMVAGIFGDPLLRPGAAWYADLLYRIFRGGGAALFMSVPFEMARATLAFDGSQKTAKWAIGICVAVVVLAFTWRIEMTPLEYWEFVND